MYPSYDIILLLSLLTSLFRHYVAEMYARGLEFRHTWIGTSIAVIDNVVKYSLR